MNAKRGERGRQPGSRIAAAFMAILTLLILLR
jgi:hypothetical protein